MSSAGASGAPRKRIVFLGTPDVAAASLNQLLDASGQGAGGGFDVVAVVTQPPAPAGRKMRLTPSAVQEVAAARSVRVLAPASAKDDAFLSAMTELAPDLCVTAAYGQFLPKRFLQIPKLGTLNVHPSLLPRWRGASPVQRCLEAGDAETGVSVVVTVLKMDAGPIVSQRRRALKGDEKAPQLLSELFKEGTEALLDALPAVWDGSLKLTDQREEDAVAAAKISAADAYCDLAKLSALEVHNRVRGFTGWPGTWTHLSWGDPASAVPQKVKIVTTTAEAGPETGASAGALASALNVRAEGDALAVNCGGGGVLRILELQAPGKKPMAARAFVNGLRGAPVRWVAPPLPPPAPFTAAAAAGLTMPAAPAGSKH